MISPSTLIYDCPCCGQGGLEIVRIKSNPPAEAIVCSECECIWIGQDKVGFHTEDRLESILSRFGLSASWTNLERIGQGVLWERLDPAYQSILSSKQQA